MRPKDGETASGKDWDIEELLDRAAQGSKLKVGVDPDKGYCLNCKTRRQKAGECDPQTVGGKTYDVYVCSYCAMCMIYVERQ